MADGDRERKSLTQEGTPTSKCNLRFGDLLFPNTWKGHHLLFQITWSTRHFNLFWKRGRGIVIKRFVDHTVWNSALNNDSFIPFNTLNVLNVGLLFLASAFSRSLNVFVSLLVLYLSFVRSRHLLHARVLLMCYSLKGSLSFFCPNKHIAVFPSTHRPN